MRKDKKTFDVIRVFSWNGKTYTNSMFHDRKVIYWSEEHENSQSLVNSVTFYQDI